MSSDSTEQKTRENYTTSPLEQKIRKYILGWNIDLLTDYLKKINKKTAEERQRHKVHVQLLKSINQPERIV